MLYEKVMVNMEIVSQFCNFKTIGSRVKSKIKSVKTLKITA